MIATSASSWAYLIYTLVVGWVGLLPEAGGVRGTCFIRLHKRMVPKADEEFEKCLVIRSAGSAAELWFVPRLLSNFLIPFFPPSLSLKRLFLLKKFPPEIGFECRISFSNLVCCVAAEWTLMF